MAELPPIAQEALTLARAGAIDRAIPAALDAIREEPDNFALRMFAVRLQSGAMDLDGALSNARHALTLVPGDPLARIEVIRLSIGLDRIEDAEAELARGPLPGNETQRLKAMILASSDRPDEAVPLFRQAVERDPQDHEAWGALGSALLASARYARAAKAFARALTLRPDIRRYRDQLVEAQVHAGDGEEALDAAIAAAQSGQDPADAFLVAARIAMLLHRHSDAETLLESALTAEPDNVSALMLLADLRERGNALDEFEALLDRVEALDGDRDRLALFRARLALRRGQFAEALERAEATPPREHKGERSEIIGRALDRVGRFDQAFEAFTAMNEDGDLSTSAVAQRSQAIRDLIDARIARTTKSWVDSWSNAAQGSQSERQPAFLMGFPRSGTTLLDTFLMGHSDLCIAEEKPLMQAVSIALEDFERLATLSEADLGALRTTYFEAARKHEPKLGDRLLVDKYPLGAIDAAIIHRLFPTARILFAERHPYDVVLSGFFTRFQPTPTLISFSSLEDAARLYDRVMTLWEKSRAAMNLAVHPVRYETLVAEPEAVMRGAVEFLGLEWTDSAANHEQSAGSRTFVSSASYAQVAEPLYDRSIGRWKNYRAHLEPVIPILAPWAEKLGYEA